MYPPRHNYTLVHRSGFMLPDFSERLLECFNRHRAVACMRKGGNPGKRLLALFPLTAALLAVAFTDIAASVGRRTSSGGKTWSTCTMRQECA